MAPGVAENRGAGAGCTTLSRVVNILRASRAKAAVLFAAEWPPVAIEGLALGKVHPAVAAGDHALGRFRPSRIAGAAGGGTLETLENKIGDEPEKEQQDQF